MRRRIGGEYRKRRKTTTVAEEEEEEEGQIVAVNKNVRTSTQYLTFDVLVYIANLHSLF